MQDFQSWARPEYEYDKDTNVDQRENVAVVIQQDASEQFEQHIICSELLSRGWTYQEILLSPANLLCTQQMMWWSCSDASCSELFPENVLTLFLDPFMDQLRSQKLALKRGGNPINIWMDIISSYSRTSVSFRDDRIVAIAGIARLFLSWFPDMKDSGDLFGHFHSGIWSTNVIQQLLWRCDSLQLARRSQDYQFCWPSWSPLSSLRCYPTHRPGLNTISLTEYVAIGSSGTTGFFGTDRFGRALNESEAVLHLRSVLVPIKGLIVNDEEEEENSEEEEVKEAVSDEAWETESEETWGEASEEAPAERSVAPGEEEVAEAEEEEEDIMPIFSAGQLEDYSGEVVVITWDTNEDWARALSASKVNGVDLRALPCEIQHLDYPPEQLEILGIVLRPDHDAGHRTISNEICGRLWVRCGVFSCLDTTQSAKDLERAFALERYGWTFETGVSDNRGEMEEAYVHLAHTGAAPDLDDVFIL